MRLIAATITLTVGITSLSAGDSNWTTADTVWQSTCVALLAADWCQTRQIAKNPNYFEYNPILGHHPSQKAVNRYFATVIIGHTLLSYTFKPSTRRKFQYATIGLQAAVVGRNYNIGIKAKW